MADIPQQATEKRALKFDLAFIPAVDAYITKCQQDTIPATIAGFAQSIGTDEESIWAWATKHKKDENGNLTDELARPTFFAAVQKLKKLEDQAKRDSDPSLNPKQELFCQLYAKSREHFGNGVFAYASAYGIDESDKQAYANARISASKLLTNSNILQRINELLRDITDEEVDQELAYVIRQNYELPSKVAAIREWNKLKSRITEKLDLTSKGKEINKVVAFNYLPPIQDEHNNPDN